MWESAPGYWHRHDAGHFDESVRPHLPRALRAATDVMGSEDLAWDAIQEALLSLWNTQEKPVDLAGWLRRATRHRALHLRRTRSRARERERRAALGRPEICEHEPGRLCQRCELFQKFEEALADLPHEQREVFRLCELEELAYEEAARLLGVPVGTVRSRLFRARAALRLTLAWLRDG